MNSYSALFVGSAFFTASIMFSFFFLRILLKSPIVNFFCDKPDPRKIHSRPIPRLGGVGLIITFFLFLTVMTLYANTKLPAVDIYKNVIWSLLVSSAIIFVSGVLDDSTFTTVRVRHKLTAEIIIGFSVVYVFNVHFEQMSIGNLFSVPLWICKLLSVLWILGLINAYNMIDGIDGLAGGISLNSVIALAVISYLTGSITVITVCLILSGSILGFLYYNKPPARIFMGDTGSLFLGTMIAIISMSLSQHINNSRAFIMMVLISGVPIIEILVTMVRRYFRAKDSGYGQLKRFHSMVTADNSHIHHRLIFRGFSHIETSIIICFLSFILCCGAICLLLIPSYGIIPLLLYLAIPLTVALDGLGFGGRFKKALHLSTTRYNGFRKKSLVGVIDLEATDLHVLKKETSAYVEYIPITEEQLPGMCRYLKAVVLKNNNMDNSGYLNFAEQVSVLINGPIFIIQSSNSLNNSIVEIYRNGSLKIKERPGSIHELVKDMKKCCSGVLKNYDCHVNSAIIN